MTWFLLSWIVDITGGSHPPHYSHIVCWKKNVYLRIETVIYFNSSQAHSLLTSFYPPSVAWCIWQPKDFCYRWQQVALFWKHQGSGLAINASVLFYVGRRSYNVIVSICCNIFCILRFMLSLLSVCCRLKKCISVGMSRDGEWHFEMLIP